MEQQLRGSAPTTSPRTGMATVGPEPRHCEGSRVARGPTMTAYHMLVAARSLISCPVRQVPDDQHDHGGGDHAGQENLVT